MQKSGLHAVDIKYENSAVRYDIFITTWRFSELTNYKRYLKTENIDNIKARLVLFWFKRYYNDHVTYLDCCMLQVKDTRIIGDIIRRFAARKRFNQNSCHMQHTH